MKIQLTQKRCRFLTGHLLATILVMGTLGALGLYVTAYKLDLIKDVRYIGHADEAAYAEMGRSLCAGRGFHVRHVSNFFIPYNKDIERREDHWPPFMGAAIAPTFSILGKSANSAKLPAILFGSIGLPIAAALLCIAFSGSTSAGFVCGLVMMANLHIFSESLKTLCDVAIAMLVAFFLAAIVGARTRPWLHVIAGVLLALVYYAKGSLLVLIPLYPLIAILACGIRSLRSKWPYAGMATVVVCILPWMVTNWISYENPLHSTQNFVSGYIGFGSWERNFYHPYWGEDLPDPSDRWQEHENRYWQVTKRNAEALTRWALMGTHADKSEWYLLGRPGAWLHQILAPEGSNLRQKRAEPQGYGAQWGPVTEWSEPISAFTGLGTLIFIALLMIAASVMALRPCIRRLIKSFCTKKDTSAESNSPSLPANEKGSYLVARLPRIEIGPALAVLLVVFAHWAFIVFLWEIRSRFAFVFLPVTAAFAVTVAVYFIRSIAAFVFFSVKKIKEQFNMAWFSFNKAAWMQKYAWIPVLLFCITVFGTAMHNADRLKEYHQNNVNLNAFPYSDKKTYPRLGDWLHINLPDAVIMSRNPWELRFHAPDKLKAVGLPYAPPQQILGIAYYYGVTHYLNDKHRPGMAKYVKSDDSHPAFDRVEGAPAKLYRIRWEKLEAGDDFVLP